MSGIGKMFAILLILSAPAVKAWSEVHVVTIYFAGTGLNKEWWQPDQTRWKNNPELLATLFHEQDDTASNQHKLFVAGIGAPPDCGDADGLTQMGFPFLPICRNWAKTMNEAEEFLLNDVLGKLSVGDTVILNLVGYSRGAVTTRMFANRVETIDPGGIVSKINTLSIDPAPGVEIPEQAKPPGTRLTKSVVIFAQDERSWLFGALIPYHDMAVTDAWMFRVRGSHETLAGNLHVNGHSIIADIPTGGTEYRLLKVIYNLTAITSVELLGSPQWGDVKFSAALYNDLYFQGMSDEQRKEVFLWNIGVMNDAGESDPLINHYDLMRRTSFTVLLESYENAFLIGPTCLPFDPLLGPPLGLHNKPRCSRRINESGNAQWQGLEEQSDIPLIGVDYSGEEAWKKIVSDTIPPTSVATASPQANAAGWNNTDVKILLTASDNMGGSGVQQITYSTTGAQYLGATTVEGSVATLTISVEGQTRVSYFATDNAGNVEAVETLVVNLDKTPPQIIGARTPAPNQYGWNNSDVTVSFTCSDTLAGLASGSPPANTVVSAEAGAQSVTATCTDIADNSATASVTGINIDKTPPTLKCIATPNVIWPTNHQLIDVATTVNVSDALSGSAGFRLNAIVSNEPLGGDPDIVGWIQGSASTAGQLRVERLGTGSGRLYTFAYVGFDKAGNSASCSPVVSVPHDRRNH